MAFSSRPAPRFVPTLTEVVELVPALTPVSAPPIESGEIHHFPQGAAALPSTLPQGMEEVLIHRIMQRVDVELDLRLREAIATVVHEQTRSMVPRLREEVESVVRNAVYEAVAQELESR